MWENVFKYKYSILYFENTQNTFEMAIQWSNTIWPVLHQDNYKDNYISVFEVIQCSCVICHFKCSRNNSDWLSMFLSFISFCALINKYNRPWHPHLILSCLHRQSIFYSYICFVNMSFLVGNWTWLPLSYFLLANPEIIFIPKFLSSGHKHGGGEIKYLKYLQFGF